MNAPAKLTLPAPKLVGLALAGVAGSTRIDKALQISLPLVKGADGLALPAEAKVGYFLYRLNDQGEQLWNEAALAWQANPGEDALGVSVMPVVMSNVGAAGWQASLNPPALTDASGAPRFTTTPPTQYFVRVLIKVGQATTAFGLSGPSPMLSLIRLASFNPGVALASWPGGGAAAPVDKPVKLLLAPLTLADGSTPLTDEVSKVGVFIQRADGLVWHDKQQGWVAAPADAEGHTALEPLALTAGEPVAPSTSAPFKAELIAMGQKDKAEAPRFVALNDGGSTYQLRAFAVVKRAGVVHIGLGGASASFGFVRLQGEERFGPLFDTEGPQDCTDVRFRLRDGAGQFSAWLRLRSNPREVELANFDGAGAPLASVRLTANGDIELRPAPGKQVRVMGDLEAERIRFQPFGGGAKQNL